MARPRQGPSDLALNHTFLGAWASYTSLEFDFSSIFRAQSGFHYSASFAGNVVSRMWTATIFQRSRFHRGAIISWRAVRRTIDVCEACAKTRLHVADKLEFSALSVSCVQV